jgi:sodium pump decarboxylase gamma subunit
MLTNLLTEQLPAGGRFVGVGEASIYALIGFAVVFFGIAFLIFVVWLVGKLMTTVNGEKPAPVKVEKVETPKKQEVAEEIAVASQEIPEETIAVIMAALMAYYQQNNSKCEFTVKRIKRL